jgi:Family of unknown function (DUF5360)
MTPLPRGLKTALLITDIGFLGYWSLTALVAAGLLNIPGEYLYSDYENPLVVAWNWSFMPLDVILSLCGLAAVALHRRSVAAWKGLAIVSLSLTFCAGLMAIAFWAIRGDFDIAWWAVNAALMIWPMFYLPALIGRDINT